MTGGDGLSELADMRTRPALAIILGLLAEQPRRRRELARILYPDDDPTGGDVLADHLHRLERAGLIVADQADHSQAQLTLTRTGHGRVARLRRIAEFARAG